MINIGGAMIKGENLEEGWNHFKSNGKGCSIFGTIPDELDLALPFVNPDKLEMRITEIVFIQSGFQMPLGMLFCNMGTGPSETAFLKLRKIVWPDDETIDLEFQDAWAIDYYTNQPNDERLQTEPPNPS